MTRLLLTGGTGFIGTALSRAILNDGSYELCVSVRNSNKNVGVAPAHVAELDADASWSQVLQGIDVVIHTAARVHVMQESSTDALLEFRKVNVEGTLNLARQAMAAGVKRFVFLSSIKVNGEATTPGKPYTADDVPNPTDAYGISKMEAENALFELSKNSSMEVVVVRPVLVYGPGVKANFLNMIRWLDKGIPLPLGCINNKRSMVCLENLISLIMLCVRHPAAANQVFLVSDGKDLSTSQLARRILHALKKSNRLLPIPSRVLEFCASVLGRKDFSRRLCGTLQVDINKTRQLLNWEPKVTIDQALSKTVAHFLDEGK